MKEEVKDSVDIFQKAASILNQNNIFFWLDQGTLLGCIRENRLLPWDHDIDFGVWKDEVDINFIISSFVNEGFKIEEIPTEMNCIHFLKGDNKKVDITLYDRETDMATTIWAAPNKGITSRIIRNIIEALEIPKHGLSYGSRGKLAELAFKLIKNMLLLFPFSFREYLLNKIKPLSYKYPEMETVKFNIPLAILSNLQKIDFLDMIVRIPVDSEKYLSHVYGDDWGVPKHKFDWRQDCGGLETVKKI